MPVTWGPFRHLSYDHDERLVVAVTGFVESLKYMCVYILLIWTSDEHLPCGISVAQLQAEDAGSPFRHTHPQAVQFHKKKLAPAPALLSAKVDGSVF